MHSKINIFILIASIVIIVAGLKLASKIFIILFLAIILASLLSPLVLALEKFKIPKFLSLLITLILVLIAFTLFFSLLSNSTKEFINFLPSYQVKLLNLSANLDNFFEKYQLNMDIKSIIASIDLNSLFKVTTKTAFGIGNFLSTLLLIIIGTFFLLAEANSFNVKTKRLLRDNKNALNAIEYFSKNVKSYFFIKFFTSLLTGLLISLMLYFFKIDYFILWGFLGFLLNFIPVIGSIIAAIPAILLSLISVDLLTTLWISLGYLIINNLVSNILEPKIMGEGLGLSPSIIFFSLIFWGYVFGAVGMFVAVILTMSIKIALDSFEETKHIAKFLGK